MPLIRRRLRVVAGVAAVPLAVATFLVVDRVTAPASATLHETAAAPEVTTTLPPPTTTSTTTTTLPVPIRPPSDPYATEPLVQLGTIEIPKIGLVHPIFQGITLSTIDHGPGHWPGTAMPGEIGNAVFAGHRVTHTHPFRRIDELRPGDLVIFDIGGQRLTYQMTGSEVVDPSTLRVADQTPERTATLFACHPPHFATYRYVVHLVMVA